MIDRLWRRFTMWLVKDVMPPERNFWLEAIERAARNMDKALLEIGPVFKSAAEAIVAWVETFEAAGVKLEDKQDE